ncbi:hypothetical protein ONZ45_g11165 [Pleurotus djamor]|nr:hypothetical protein ONZ45_g11165 [Pleurotus djamor]
MSTLKTNLDDVLRRQNQNKAHSSFTPALPKSNVRTFSLSLHPEYLRSSFFSPQDSSQYYNNLNLLRRLPSFSTPGFTSSTPGPSQSGKPLREVISISSDSDLSTPSNRSAKRSSPGPPNLSPSPKRRKQSENKENEMDLSSSTYHDPWKSLDRDYPQPTSPPKPNKSSPEHPDLAPLSLNELTKLRDFNMNEYNRISGSIFGNSGKQGETIDFVTLRGMRDFVEMRLCAITAIIRDRERSGPEAQCVGQPAPPLAEISANGRSPASVVDQVDVTEVLEMNPPLSQGLRYEPTLGEEELWNSVDEIEHFDEREGDDELVAPTENIPLASVSTSLHSEIMKNLRGTFHLTQFRPHQQEAVEATLRGEDVFVLMPTGGGKSLCYQLPAVCEGGKTRGVTFVVSPLIALIADQVNSLQAKGIDALQWTSESGPQTSDIMRALKGPRKPKLVYVTPEKLQASGSTKQVLSDLYRANGLARFVIDEAHCISTWGRDFREAYTGLNVLREQYPNVPIMALTATANQGAVKDIISRLKIDGCVELVQSFNRKNLNYEVVPKAKGVVKTMADWIQSRHPRQTGIVYCLSRKNCEEIANKLRSHGLSAKHYHAQLSIKEKEETQDQWQKGECLIIVATIAFGMGIDKPDVRFVIHHSLPKTLDGYYQETGRAGRDGLPADCLLYFAYGDATILQKMIRDPPDGTVPSPDTIEYQEDGVRQVLRYCDNDVQCRRVQILSYFDETFNPKNCDGMCDNCQYDGDIASQDVSKEAKDVIKLVESLQDSNVTQTYISSIYKGSGEKAIKQRGHDNEELYGAGRHLSPTLRDRLVFTLLIEGALTMKHVANASGFNNQYICLGPKATQYLRNEKQVVLTYRSGTPTVSKKGKQRAGRAPKPVATPIDEVETLADLFDDDHDPIEPSESFDVEDVPNVPPPKVTSVRSVRTRLHKDSAAPSVELHNVASPTHPDPTTLLAALQARHEEIRKELGKGFAENTLFDGSALELIATMQPKGSKEFRDVVECAARDILTDEEDIRSLADGWTHKYEKALLEIIKRDERYPSDMLAEPSTSFNVTKLQQRYDYMPRTTSTEGSSSAAPRSKFRPVSAAHNPLLDEYILVSPHRTKRPWLGQVEPPQVTQLPEYDEKCYLCPGNVRSNGERNDNYEDTFVFENDFAALLPDRPEAPKPLHPLLVTEPVHGGCDVLVFHPRHDLTLARLDVKDIGKIIEVWTSIYRKRGEQEGIKYVQIFENKGLMMGCSNPHPHGQVWSLSAVPSIPSKELTALRRYAESEEVKGDAPLGPNGRPCMLCDYAHVEVNMAGDSGRVVSKNDDWVALVPWWATWPFEILLLPFRRHIPSLLDLSVGEKESLAEMLSRITVKYDNLFSCSFAYSMGIHQRPVPGDEEGGVAHLHFHFTPPLLRSATVRKFLVGYELMAEAQRDLTPEQGAERLRRCSHSQIDYLTVNT